MSQAEIDSILKKYDKSIPKPKIDYLYTQRKRQAIDPQMITFMDNNYTPTKQVRDSHTHTHNSSRIEQLLRQLDESQKKFVISQKNYAEICRKYDKLKQAYETISTELERQRKIRLQQLIDFQNKLELLKVQNNKNQTKLQSKQHTISILKQKLCQKQQQIVIFQHQLQEISERLCHTLQLKNSKTNSQIYSTQQQHLQSIKLKHQKSMKKMNEQLNRISKLLQQKQKQRKKLLQQIQNNNIKYLEQNKQIKQMLYKNEQQYKIWLDQGKNQKIELVEKYEQQIRDLRKNQLFNKLSKSDDLIQITNKAKPMIKQLQHKNTGLLIENKRLKSQIENNCRIEKQSQIKFKNLEDELKYMKLQITNQINENKKLLVNLKIQQQKYQKMRNNNNKTQIQLQSLKIKFAQSQNKCKNLERQVQNLKADIGKQLKSLIYVKKQLTEATNNQLNINSTLTQASIKLQQKIKALQLQLQQIKTQLYAQRLQKAKLAEQLEQTKIDLKRQYDLSLQNTRRQLQQQIKQNLNVKSQKEIKNEKMYLKMFKIQRQYELLKSQVVTAEQMLKMGTKMNKYYKRSK